MTKIDLIDAKLSVITKNAKGLRVVYACGEIDMHPGRAAV